MKTSSFDSYRGNLGIGIAARSPDTYTGPTYPPLFPKWGFFKQYKGDKNVEAYVEAYYSQVLKYLDPQKVYNEIGKFTLLCWEPPGEFCHRRIVAEWIEEHLQIKVIEDEW